MKETIDLACIRVVNDPLISLKEKKSNFVLANPDRKEITEVKVDGCAIKEGCKCDFLLLDGTFEYFIELKGSDVKHAVEQLKASIFKLSKEPKLLRKYAFVVSTCCPLIGADIQLIQKKFKKEFNAEFVVKKTPAKHVL